MKQGVLTDQRVRLLLRKGLSCYRPRRKVSLIQTLFYHDDEEAKAQFSFVSSQGERKRKSVRGAIVGPDLSVLNLVVAKRGENVSLHFIC